MYRKWSGGGARRTGGALPAVAAVVALALVSLVSPAIASARGERVMVYCVSSEQPAPTFTPRSEPNSCLVHHAGEGNFEDAYTYVTRMRWSNWGAPSVHGAGTIIGNMQFRAPAQVTLSRLRSCGGWEVYTRFAIAIRGNGSYAMPIDGCPRRQANKGIHPARLSTTTAYTSRSGHRGTRRHHASKPQVHGRARHRCRRGRRHHRPVCRSVRKPHAHRHAKPRHKALRHATKHPQTGAAAPTVGTVLGTYEGQGRINVIGGTSGFSIIDSLTNLTTNRDESTVTAYDAAGKELARLAPGSLTGECGAADVHVPGKGRLLLTMLVSIRKAEGFTPSSHSVALQAWSASTGKQVWSATLVPWTSEEGAYMGEGECKAYDGALRGFSNTSDGRWGVELEGENGPQGGYVINLATGSVRHDPHALGAVGNAVVDEMPNLGNQEVEPNGEYKYPILDLSEPASGAILGGIPNGVSFYAPAELAPREVFLNNECAGGPPSAGENTEGTILFSMPSNEGYCSGAGTVIAYSLPSLHEIWQTSASWQATMMGNGGNVLLGHTWGRLRDRALWHHQQRGDAVGQPATSGDRPEDRQAALVCGSERLQHHIEGWY